MSAFKDGDVEFADALRAAGRRDAAGSGARERALQALGIGAATTAAAGAAHAGGKMGTLGLTKWLLAVALFGGVGIGTWRIARPSTAPAANAPTNTSAAANASAPTNTSANGDQRPSERTAAEPWRAPPSTVPADPAAARAVAPAVAHDPPPACSTRGRPIELELTNTTSAPIDVLWIDYECQEIPKGRVAPGAVWKQRSYDTHPWRVRDAATQRLIRDFAPSQTSDFTVAVEDRGVRDEPAATCSARGREQQTRFENRTASPVELFWVDYQCREISYGTIAAGATRLQNTFDTHPWRVRDASTHRLLEDLVPKPLAPLTLELP